MKLFRIVVLFSILAIAISGCGKKIDYTNISNLTGLKVRIETTLINESIVFYTEYLGLTVLQQWNDQGDRGVIFGLDSRINGMAFLELGYKQTPKNFAGMSIQIRVNSLDEAMIKLQDNVKFTGPEIRPWGSKYLYLEDPSGIPVILYEGKL